MQANLPQAERQTSKAAFDELRNAFSEGKSVKVDKDNTVSISTPSGFQAFFVYLKKLFGFSRAEEATMKAKAASAMRLKITKEIGALIETKIGNITNINTRSAIDASRQNIDTASADNHAIKILTEANNDHLDKIECFIKNGKIQEAENELTLLTTKTKNYLSNINNVITQQIPTATIPRQKTSWSYQKTTNFGNDTNPGKATPPKKTQQQWRIEELLINRLKFSPESADEFSADVAIALGDLHVSLKTVLEWKGVFFKNNPLPKNISQRTTLSAMIAVLQILKKEGESPIHDLLNEQKRDKAEKIVLDRIRNLPIVRGMLPSEIQIDCVHQGMALNYGGNLSADEKTDLDTELETLNKYKNTKNESLLTSHPLLQNLEAQFAADFTRSRIVLLNNGKSLQDINKLQIKARQTTVQTTSEDNEATEIRNKWLKHFCDFFQDPKASKVASHYLSQTVLGVLGETWIKCRGNTTETGGEKSSLIFLVDRIEDEPTRYRITLKSEKFGKAAVCLNPTLSEEDRKTTVGGNNTVPILPIKKYKNSADIPTKTEEIVIELNLEEMKNEKFNPKTIKARVENNFQIDWNSIDELLEDQAAIG